MDNVQKENIQQSVILNIGEHIMILVFIIMITFLPVLKRTYEYTPKNPAELYELSDEEIRELSSRGYIIKKDNFSVYDDFSAFLDTVKSDDNDAEIKAMAFVDSIMVVSFMICVLIMAITSGIKVISGGMQFLTLYNGGTPVRPIQLIVMKTANRPLISLPILVVIDAFSAGFFTDLIGMESVRCMPDVTGVSFWIVFLVIAAVALAYVGNLRYNCDLQLQQAALQQIQ